MDDDKPYRDLESFPPESRRMVLYATVQRAAKTSSESPFEPHGETEERVVRMAKLSADPALAYGSEHVDLLVELIENEPDGQLWISVEAPPANIPEESLNRLRDAWDAAVATSERKPSTMQFAIRHMKYCAPEHVVELLDALIDYEESDQVSRRVGVSRARSAFEDLWGVLPADQLLSRGKRILQRNVESIREQIERHGVDSPSLHLGFKTEPIAKLGYMLGEFALAQEMADMAMMEREQDGTESEPHSNFTSMKRYVGIVLAASMAYERGDIDSAVEYIGMIKTLRVPPQFHEEMLTLCELVAVLTKEGHGDRVEAALAGSEQVLATP